MSNLAHAGRPATQLDDRYTRIGRVFLSGTQALIRLPMLQRERDLAAGLNTAGFISGYRGSPLGPLDQGLWKAKVHLAEHHITFQPGLNEDMAATAVWGSQQVGLFPGARYDGVFGLWYGKGPGVDRCGDVFRHANAAGTSKFGGVLVVAGDDHAAKSSTLPHQTEHIFKAVLMPVLYPANVQEYIDFGLHGWAMSRYSGCWVAFKALADTVETSASVLIDPSAVNPILPPDFELPPDGLNIRWPDPPLAQEKRLLNHKLYAALAYCRANRLDRLIIDPPQPRLGILTAGKSYLDVRQALDELGIDETLAAQIGLRLYKVGMVWPLEPEGVRRFAEGLEEILVVEEKRQLLEYQLKEELYNWREDVRPRVIGKFDEKGEWTVEGEGGYLAHSDWLLAATGELPVATIARVIAGRIGRFFTSPAIHARLKLIAAKQQAANTPTVLAERKPHFCSGCPHNCSTKVPEGSRAVAGIGCHYMVTWMDRSTATYTHMGGEGVPWVGQAPFTSEKHIFANLGDGTYFHSGLLAIRQAVAAKVNITYKILYNDAVAMTGGQPVDGQLDVPRLSRQLAAEGVGRIVVVAADPTRYAGSHDLASGVTVRHRDELDTVQRELREFPGVSALIYDQVCATEARRRRKRGKMPAVTQRVVINEAVCEGCGDCSVQSNCLSVIPIATDFGTKRAIDQSACNQDFSCLKGFCPSFVTLEGATPKRPAASASVSAENWPILPSPKLPTTSEPHNLLITGVGGMGVITLGALVGMAAHLDGKGVSVLDMTGLAQKYGAVFSHLRIADRPEDIHAARIATGEAHAVLGGDLVVSAGSEALSKMLEGRTQAVISSAETPTADFTRQRDWRLPAEQLKQRLRDTLGDEATDFIDAKHLATRLMGDALYANILLLGYAWQRGMIPVSLAALDRAIELNGTAIDANRTAFMWGRRAAVNPEKLAKLVPPSSAAAPDAMSLDALIAHRAAHLTSYQHAALANRYRDRLGAVRQLGDDALTRHVAEQYARLLAPKDEYEVARLYTETGFIERLKADFDGDFRIQLYLAPPWLAGNGPDGRPRKRRLGAWLLPVLRLLAGARGLRGGWLDPFRFSAERQVDRSLLADYEADLDLLLQQRPTPNIAHELASWPSEIRGYGPVRAAAIPAARARRDKARKTLME
ncbi:indolepyruvate ferredoxin oxidoreductase family protein [Dechloromonas sp.]|uniref:indolepyruvate ferredoxin oxidoreductase family protein n=1 Tax=Dechloromonas sp. TaxID=1917218 RepID=UPI001203D543|nr:indolepyruvate ferredoxin oxidoreductase family protein [Dechloromonas sp.]MBU3696284.1 indolepyruvate ferredoxin oxidoreductase family protein [Dechloromonas sp.]TEX49269.1 MAG: indolepyruvate ferredoxin oxidoreductase [Rhodocyclaceae bacterium]